MDGFELNDDDVVSMKNPDFETGETFKAGQILEKVKLFLNINNKGILSSKTRWFTKEGAKCQVLQAKGGGWQSGRLRFRLEFVPDNSVIPPNAGTYSESLDEFRQ